MFDVNEVRKDFPMIQNNKDLIYFDSGATSFKPKCVIDAVMDYYTLYNSNIHRGDYDISVKVSKEYDDTRKTIARFIGADDPRCIVFTSGSTSALNLVAYNFGNGFLKQGDVILTSQVEHASNILPWFKAAEKAKAKIEYVPLNADATFDLKKYEDCFAQGNIKVVVLPHVSNVMGYIYPVKKIAEIAHAHGALVSIDGAQGVPHVKVDVKDLDIDFLSFSSHKMLGPAGAGVLYGKYDLLDKMEPLMYGGDSNARFYNDGTIILKGVPEKFESGTPCIEGVLGMNEAARYLMDLGMENVEEYGRYLTRYFIEKLEKLDNVEIYNPRSEAGIVSFNLKGIFAQDAASYFNKCGVALRSGTHCAKLIHNIINVTESLRATFNVYNTTEEIDRFVEIIRDTTIEKCVDSIL